MDDFIFDLQRFDDLWKVGDNFYSSLTNALAVVTGNSTIALTADASENLSGTIASGTTIDLGGKTFTITGGNLTLENDVTFTNGNLNIVGGTFSGDFNFADDVAVSISGGTFSTDVSAYLAQNFELIQSGNNYIVGVTSNDSDTATVISGNKTLPLTIGTDQRTIRAGSDGNINVTVIGESASQATGAIISLSSAGENFFVETDDRMWKYQLGNIGSDGVIITIGSGSAAIIGALDKGDIFSVTDVSVENNTNKTLASDSFSMTSTGLLLDSGAFVNNSALSSISLTSAALDASTSDLYKVKKLDMNGDKAVLKITAASDFTYDTTAGYLGVYVMDTASTNIYAKLEPASKYTDNYYAIQSVATSAENTIATISVENETILTSGISFTKNFVGNTDSAPTIVVGQTALNVNSLTSNNNYFVLSGSKTTLPVSLNSSASEISLIKGSIVTTNDEQTINTGTYAISSYNPGSANTDGIIIYGDGSNATVSDIEKGESFAVQKGDSLTSYKMTSHGLIKGTEDSVLPLVLNGNFITDNTVAVADLDNATTKEYDTSSFLDARNTIAASNGPVTIAYGGNAFATLSGSNSQYTLLTNDSYDDLHLGEWGGIKLSSGTIYIPKSLVGSSDLKIMGTNATLGVTNTTISSNYVTIASNISSVPNEIKAVNLYDGNLTINGYGKTVNIAKANNINLKSSSNGLNQTIKSDSSGATISYTGNGVGFYLGRGYIRESGGSPVLTIDTLGNTNINVKFSVQTGINQTEIWNPSNKVTLVYGKEDGISVTGLNNNDSFACTVGSTTTTYSVIKDQRENNWLMSYGSNASGTDFKLLTVGGGISENALYDLDDDNFKGYLISNNGNITVSSDSMGENDAISILDATVGSKPSNVTIGSVYGTLTKPNSSSSSYKLNVYSGSTVPSVLIKETAPVELTGNFYNTTVTVDNGQKASFIVLDNDDSNFNVSLQNDSDVYVGGLNNISLLSNSIVSDSTTQTINLSVGDSSTYAISYTYDDTTSTVKNGINVGFSVIDNETVPVIGGIDVNESFYVNGQKYTRKAFPLYFVATDSAGKTSSYVPSTVSGDLRGDEAVAIRIDALESTKRNLIAAESASSTYYGAEAKILEIGSTHKENALVVDSEDPASTSELYADFEVISLGSYLLDTVDGGETSKFNADIISIAGGTASINKEVANDKVIVAAGSQAVFKVNSAVEDSDGKEIFVVNGSSTSPQSVGGATQVNLLDGKINAVPTVAANKSQTITLGESEKHTLQMADNSTVSYSKADSVGTINGLFDTATSIGTGFTLDSENRFSVVGGNGMNFAIGDDSGVVVTGLNQTTPANPDTFLYDGNYYSMRSAGFVRADSNKNANALWNKDEVHTLAGGSVAISDIDVADDANWINIRTIDIDTKVASLPSGNLDGSLVYVDVDYKYTYGKLTNGDEGYSLTKDNATSTISSIFIPTDSNATSLTVGQEFKNITINAPNYADVALKTVSSDYTITRESSLLSFSGGVDNVSLLSGRLASDSNVAVAVFIDSSTAPKVKAVGGDNTITLTAGTNAAVILDTQKSIAIDGTNYTLGSVGLTKSGNKFLPSITNSEQNTLKISDVTDSDKWYNLIAVDTSGSLTISGATQDKTFVVDSATAPTEQYASIATASGGFVLNTVTSRSDWADENTIVINGTTATINKAFMNKAIVGNKSNAAFVVTGNGSSNTFVVTDSSSGASVSANALTQTAGTITTANKNQTITTSDNYEISFVDGDAINVVINNGNTSIAALDSSDAFKIGEETYTVTSGKRLITDDSLRTETIDSRIIDIADLTDANWKKYVSISNGKITVNSSAIENLLSGGESAYIIDSGDDATIYGTIYKDNNNGYLLNRKYDDTKNGTVITDITIDKTDAPISLTSDFTVGAVSLKAGNTTFHVGSVTSADNIFALEYDGNYVEVSDANRITLDTGAIKTDSTLQTIFAVDSANDATTKIYATSLNDSIWVSDKSGSISVGGLDTGDKFVVDSTTYTYTDIGVINANAKTISDNNTVEASDGVFSVGTAFSKDILTLTDNELDLSNQSNSAVVVDTLDSDNLPTTILAGLNYSDSTFTITSNNVANPTIESVKLGNRDIVANINFNASVKAGGGAGNHTFTINSGAYKAADSSELVIQSGTNKQNKSTLLSGSVLLEDSEITTVRTTNDTVSVSGGDITVKADNSEPVTITGLNDGDIFTADKVNYTVKGDCLIKDGQVWNTDFNSGVVLSETATNGLTNSDNWNSYISVSEDTVLAVPPTNSKNINKWLILSNALDSIYGTLTSSDTGGYSFAADPSWDTTTLNYVSINADSTSFSFPATSFQGVKIKTKTSGAEFSILDDKNAFTVTDNKSNYSTFGDYSNYASIAGATGISQTGGTIALIDSTQTITATTTEEHDISFMEGGASGGILVMVDSNAASIGSLTKDGTVDKFIVDDHQYQMLSSGGIMRINENQYWLGDTIANNGSVDVDELTDDNNWLKAIKINNGILTIDSNTLGLEGLSTAFIVDSAEPTNIYGQLSESDKQFTLDGATATEALSSIIIDESATVSLTGKYLDIPITAVDTIFAAINISDGFTVDYSEVKAGYAASLSTNAQGVSLLSGAWNLSSMSQTLKADGQTIQLGASGAVQASIISGGVDVTGIDANEIVTINSDVYKINAGDGISVSLTSDKVATVKDISDGDNFTVNDDTSFIKRSAGFIKKNTNNYLWINEADVTGGVLLSSINTDNDNWAGVATVDGSITINKNSMSAVLIDSVDSLSSIYGALTKSEDIYTLSSTIGAVTANAKPTAITVAGVNAGIDGYYAKTSIYAAGASFIVNALTSTDSLFSVGATTSNATLGNVAEVSLVSGTLADLTNATTVKTTDHTVAAVANSTINVGLNNEIIIFSDLDDGEGFTFDKNAYVYKDVGVVKNNQTLYVNASLKGTVTNDTLTGATYQEMFASGGGSTLILQSKKDGVFVDNAGNSVSKVYALQSYDADNKLYTLTKNTVEDFVVDAATLASGASISAPFKTQIITPATGTFTVNDKSYAAVNALTIDTTADSSTLNKGTATLAAGVSVAMTNGDNISVTSGNGIQVAAEPNSYTLRELDKDDVFSIGDYTYSMRSDNYLFRTKDGTTELCTTSVTGGALSSAIIGSDDNWDNYFLLEKDNTLNLSGSSIASGTVISYDLNKIYADLTVKGNNNKFTLEKITGSDTTEISKISLGADNSTLTVDFAATVKTTSGTGTYTINDSPYTAKDSALEIVTDANSSSITSGVITLSNSPEITTSSNHTISGTVAELDVAKMNFTPINGNTFAVDGATYKLNTIGLTKNDSYLWTKSSAENFVLPANDSLWSDMMTLNKDGTLNLKNGVSANSVAVLDNARTKRMALLTYSDNAYTLTSEGGNSIATIQLGDSADSILSLTNNFESSILTGNGLYKINGNNYRGSGLTITTADNGSALYAGTVSLSSGTIYNSISDTVNSYDATGGDGITATATKGSITTLGNLNRGDTFITGSKYYKVLDNDTLVQTDSDGGTATKLYKGLITSGELSTANIVEDNFVDFIKLGEDGALDLTKMYGASGWSGIVVEADEAGDYTLRIAQVTFDGEGYKLDPTAYGTATSLKSVSLGSAVQTFTTSIGTTVNTTATTSTYTINGQPFTAQDNLKIAASANGTEAILINGAVTLPENVEVTTRRINDGTQTDETIKTTSGSITVTVDETAGTVNISGLNPGEKFTAGGVEYTMTPIGLQNGSLLNPSVASTGSIPTTDLDLSGDNWLTILQMTNGALTLDSSTASNVFVVDMTSATQAVKYGTLTKTGDVYTFAQDDSDAKLTSIALNGVRATFGTKSSDIDITTNGETTFSVTATGDFTINAATGGNPIVSDVTNVSGINLSAGTIVAPTNIPITASGYAIKATNGDMNISIVDGAAQISGLERDDEFTVDDTTNYKMVDIGLLDVTNQQLRTQVEDTYTIGEAFTRIIAVNGTNLDLSGETKSANVYDSISEPRTQLGTLTISKGVKTLAAVGSGATVMQSIDIANKDNLTVNFDTRVNAPAGTVTVNGEGYAGTTALAIDSDGKTSTLYSGTITLDIATPSATDSSGNTLAREIGTFNATAADGKFTTLTNLANAESFTYNNTNYTQNIPGLINTTGNVIFTNILAGATINLADLASATWNNFTAPVDGVLNISALNSNHIIYDDATTPTTKYATLTIKDGKKTLTGEKIAADVISEVVIANGDNLAVDFVTQVDAPIGSVTVNDKSYAGTTELLIDSDGNTSTLYDGTITLDGTNATATDSTGNTLTRSSGSFTATAVEGAFTQLNGLDNTESFTYGGVTYVQSAQGLRNGSLIRRDLTGTTIDLSKLGGTWDNILAPVDGVLDISNFSGNAFVYNSATNPTNQLAILTTTDGVKTLTNSDKAADSISAVQIAAGNNLAVDFVTQIYAPVGSVTVNDKNYVETTELIIDSDGATSTLFDGTITLAGNGDAIATTGGTSITYTTEGGDGLTLAVDNSGESEIVTFSGLTAGDTFTIDGAAYKVSAVAPINPSGELWTGGDYSGGITLAQINDATNWTPMLAAPDAVLSVDAETFAEEDDTTDDMSDDADDTDDVDDTTDDADDTDDATNDKRIVVDNVDDPTKIYGELTKGEDAYTLTRPTTANDDLTSINVDGVAIEIAPDYAGVNFTANDSAFSDVALTDETAPFTLDATSTPSLSGNVNALTLTAGTVEAAINQAVTTGNSVITPTAINGEMVISTATISGIVEGDTFTLNDKAYVMISTGLFNDTDNKLVTSGIAEGTLTIADLAETQLLPISNGELNLTNAVAGNSLVVDKVESPEHIYGALNKDGNIYKLDKRADGITSITLPDAAATLTTDIAATVNAPSSSNTYIVNSKVYKANNSALTIASDGTTSTLTTGTINLAAYEDTVTTTSGSTITYTTNGDGMTLAVTNNGITFSGLTTGDTFTIDGAAYKVSAVAPINPTGELWTGGDYSGGITLAQINDASNWTPMLAAPDAVLSVDAETLTDGGKLIVVDNVDDPTKIYGELTKAEDAYTLTRPTTANDDLTSINVDGVAIEIAPDYAGVNFTANDSAFSDVALTDETAPFTLDATSTPSLSGNVNALTLTAGTVEAAVNQAVTTGENVITPTAINGEMIISTATISGIVEGDTFSLNDKAYVMISTGLFNDTDNKLVTSGIAEGTLTIADLAETQLLPISNGELNLTNAVAGNSLVVDKAESPENIYGALNKDGNIYKLDKRADGITSITLPDAAATLTTDIAATVNAPSSSNTYIVNSKVYKANNSALTIASDGTTSTLTTGTINLAAYEDTVTTTSGSTITYTTAGDGMTLAVTTSGITFSGLTTGDTFTIDGAAYKVSAVAPINPSGELWTGGDYSGRITLAQINDASNWTPMLAAPDAVLSVDAETLTDGGKLIVVDNVDDPTKIYGELTKAEDAYTLTRPTTANDDLTSINVDGVAIEIAPDYASVNFTANDSAFSDVALTDETAPFTLDATSTPSLSGNVNALTLTAGTVEAAINQAVTTGNSVITPTAINGEMIISTATISGIVEGDAFSLNDKAYVMISTGLFNDTDNKLVTSGIAEGTLTIADLAETQLLPISNGELNLTNAVAGNSLVVDKVESPEHIYGALNKDGNIYKLDKRADGITSITLPDAAATLTTDIAATVNAPSSSNTYIVNSKVYKANNSALTIASDGTTSTLTTGTVNLASNEDTVTTTSGSTITYTTAGDGMTVTAAGSSVTLNALTTGDTFTVGDNAYRVTALGFHNDANYLWTSSADYKSGVTVAQIDDAANWTRTVIANNDRLSVNDETLTDGVTALVIDSASEATKTLGTLKRTGDTYTLTKDATNKLSAIAVDNTKLAIDNQLADVPVTADGATFTVTTTTPYTVDATGNTVSISDDATAIEISAGTIAATINQTVTATADSGKTAVIGQNNGTFNVGGETFAVVDNVGSVTFGMTNGVPDSVRNLEGNASVTIDGRTYTAPQDNLKLLFNDDDGWYFEGYVPTRYNITIDGNGNVIVDAGIKFTDVVASGQTLPQDGTIKLAVDINSIPINVTNAGTTAININDKDDKPLVENLGTVENVTFDSAGVMVENTSDVAGAVFTIDTDKSLETETATITANADACAVGVGANGTSLSVDKAATINAPADTALTLGDASYTANGVNFTTGGTAQASLTSDGVKVDLAISDPVTYNQTKFDGTDTATAEINKSGGISLTSGASVDGASGKSFNIAGTVTLDANTIDAASATDVTAKASGYAVANDDVTVTGDDGYKVDISDGKISGLENIGSESGVTIGGLMSGTIKTDKVGALTVADKTFIAIGDASVTYGIENGTLTSADDVASVISGDFSDGLTVNGGKLQVTGDDVSLDVRRNRNRKVSGFDDKATLTTADNVVKIEPTGAGEFTFGDHIFKTDDATIAFNLKNSSVTGIDSLENGNLIIYQDESNFQVNGESIDLAELDAPVTLEIADSGIHSVYGLHSGMDGLDVATVFGVSAATVNNKYFEIAGGTLDVVVVDSVPTSLYGLESDMTINSAPSVAIRTTENGTFTFRDDVFNINDTLDGVVVFNTDENTHVTNIGEFAGEIFGDLKDTALNDKAFNSSSDKVTVISDGTDILKLNGLSSGDTIGGSLSNATYLMPEGTLTVNDRGYILQGDDNGVSMTGDGQVVVGLDKDASLTVTKGGAYSVNDQDFNAKDGDTFIAGRDYVYIADPNNKPISDKTKIDDIIENLLGKQEKGTVSLSGDSAARAIASGNLDSPMALTLDNANGSSVQTADFSDSYYSKRVTLLGGNQDVKFNDEGGNAAYVDKTATGKKNIELGNGNDVAVNDSPYAKVSIKAGAGADTIVNRNGAKSTVDVKNNGDTTIVPTSGRVTLQNYDNDNNAKIRTFEYRDLGTAIASNEIKFGDGTMTLGDAIIVFDPDADKFGGTFTNLVDYSGEEQRVGFTHGNGGVLNASLSRDDLILKGNYAQQASDKIKSGGSTLISGRGDDTILAGGDDYVDAGAGENQIYITDRSLSGGAGATIVLGVRGRTTLHNFNDGFEDNDAIQVNDISALKFIFDEGGLVMRSGGARITFDGLEPAEDLVTYSDSDVAAHYEIKLSDGKGEYNAVIAQEGSDIGVSDYSEANLFFGDRKSKTGLNFSEYTGAIEVNLDSGIGTLNGTAAQFYNISKVTAGAGNSSLIGKAGAQNTLIAGTGNTSMWSAAGRDLMTGNTSEEKDGSTMFYYLPGDGRDTITNFDFMTSADDYTADIINITAANDVGDVYLRGTNVVIQLNSSPDDYLTVVDAQGKYMRFNEVIAKVDVNANFDELANCYVATGNNATMSLGAGIDKAQIWLDDRRTGQHGIYYLGEFKYLDGSAATGNSTLVGNDLENVIYGGAGQNSIWGGFGNNDDTLIGGTGHNTFFFGMANGHDVITSVQAGDVVDLTTIGLEQITATTVDSGGAKIQLTDGSSLEIQGTAAAEYRLKDGSTYTADHSSGQFIKK